MSLERNVTFTKSCANHHAEITMWKGSGVSLKGKSKELVQKLGNFQVIFTVMISFKYMINMACAFRFYDE